MTRLATFALRAVETAALLSLAVGVTVLAAVVGANSRDEDACDCGGTCPACDVGPDDMESPPPPRFLILDGPTLGEFIQRALIDRACEGETCPDYVHEIEWGAER
jgi:hypothetical protein